MAWRRVGYDKVALRGREVGLVETKSMARRVEVRMGGFHLSDGHRSCCAFHCRVRRRHLSARKSAESDCVIVNSTERLPYESSLHSGDSTGAFLFEGGASLFEGGAAAA